MLLLIPAGCLNPQNSWTRGGIGAVLSDGEDGVTIKKMNAKFARQDAVLLPGDLIVMIDDVKTSDLTIYEVSEALTGPVGSTVTVSVMRNNAEYTVAVDRIMQKRAAKQILKSTLVSAPESQESESTDKKENR